ncbi:copper-binding protein [Massilia sp. Mn16-1_5]|uniref:copper-binding protein n=1 Tax=Massilia sp. Mn16-1_5 TaxID=2079199 RepID=UPI00109E86D8|nr:copper-binding protein [Massilia sp. Mn16-1_5]THC44502.1 RND transporter [Massilia sp. Mn16-1_5]
MMKISRFALALAMAAAVAGASAQDHAGHDAPAAQQAPALALVDGEVKKIDRETGKITLRHGEIPNLNMGAMTMVFRTRNAAMLDEIKVGDKVSFSADRVGGAITVVQLQKVE